MEQTLNLPKQVFAVCSTLGDIMEKLIYHIDVNSAYLSCSVVYNVNVWGKCLI